MQPQCGKWCSHRVAATWALLTASVVHSRMRKQEKRTNGLQTSLWLMISLSRWMNSKNVQEKLVAPRNGQRCRETRGEHIRAENLHKYLCSCGDCSDAQANEYDSIFIEIIYAFRLSVQPEIFGRRKLIRFQRKASSRCSGYTCERMQISEFGRFWWEDENSANVIVTNRFIQLARFRTIPF